MTTIQEKIVELLKEYKDDVIEDVNTNLIELGLMDSLMMMNMLACLEDEFDIEIDGDDISKENFCSVAAMAALVERCRE